MVSEAPYLSLILPAYNEAGRIRHTIEHTQAYLNSQGLSHEILVVADGDDGTREIVADMGRRDNRLRVFGSVERHGKGHGIRLGVRHCRGQVIGFADADYKVPIEELSKLLPWIGRGYDVVIGSRRAAESHIEVKQPLYRRLGSLAFLKVVHTLFGLHEIRDTQCGFKFFRAPVARDLFARQRVNGYMFDLEVLYLAARSGYRLKEVGVCWRDDGDTRSSPLLQNWRYVLDVLRIRFRSDVRGPRPASVEQSHTTSTAA
jgi:dolichyl-phosphate beta-glucosyltransferase